MNRRNAALAATCALLALSTGCRTPNFESQEMSAEARAQWERAAPSPPPLVAALPVEPQVGPAPEGVAAATGGFPLVFTDPAPRLLQLRSARLDQALRLLAATGGVSLVLQGDFSPVVELDLPEVPLQAALELLARTHDCRIELQDGLVVVSRDDPAKVESRVFEVASVAAASLQPDLAAIVTDGSVVVNAARNVIMVTAPQPRLREVERYLASIDRPERQVLIEARLLEVSRKDLEELGTRIAFNDLDVADETATFVSSLLAPSNSVLGTVTSESGGFDAAINALHSLVGLEVLSRPRLLALNNRQANLDIVTEIPYVSATTTSEGSAGGTGAQTIEEIEYKIVGLKLAVTPSILEGGLVSLSIDQEVSEQTGTFQGVPIVDSRHIVTGFVVGEGQTILIGGLLKQRRLDSRDGVPLLMDLPLIGQAFRRDVRDDQQVELILLMTPWLVSAEDGRAASADGLAAR
jgi:type II secretory pathway component GspD/PulD (secretin)